MMSIEDMIRPEHIMAGLTAGSYRHALRALLRTGVPGREERVFKLITEQPGGVIPLPSTGAAIISCPTNQVAEVTAIVGQLSQPVELEGTSTPAHADLLCILLAPRIAGAEQLRALALLSRHFKDKALCSQIHGCTDADAIYSVLAQLHLRDAA